MLQEIPLSALGLTPTEILLSLGVHEADLATFVKNDETDVQTGKSATEPLSLLYQFFVETLDLATVNLQRPRQSVLFFLRHTKVIVEISQKPHPLGACGR
jgi:hypothetical protein